MHGLRHQRLKGLALAGALAAASAWAGPPEQAAVARLSRQDRGRLERLASLSPPALAAAAEAMSADSLKTRATALQADPKRELAARLAALEPAGVRVLGSFRLPVATPVPRGGEEAKLEIGGQAWRVDPLWPNGAMPSLCPAGGIAGKLVDARAAEWADIDGLDLTGALALMDFKGDRNWGRLFSLGCAAVIVCEDGYVNRENAEGLFCSTPVPCPRFYVNAAGAAALRALAAARPAARLSGGSVYANRIAESVFAYLPPTPPLRLRIGPDDLLERVAFDFGLDAAALKAANGPDAGDLRAGRRLAVPRQAAGYEVKPRDLLGRLARDYGVPPEAILAANPGLPEELPAGTGVTIPNLEGSQFVAVRADSVNVVASAPAGGTAAARTAAALAALEQLAADSKSVRRRGVVFAFLDGDLQGGVVSRAFAGTALRLAGLWQGAAGSGAALGAFGTPASRVERNEKVFRYLAGETARLDGPEARWLADEWLAARFETRRVELAEARIEALRGGQDAAAPADQKQWTDRREEMERDLDELARVRNATVANPSLSAGERLDAFRQAASEPGRQAVLVRLGLDAASLLARFQPERDEEKQALELGLNNDALVRQVLDLLKAPGRSATGWLWDLSDGSASLSVPEKDFRGLNPVPSTDLALVGERLREAAALASVRAGWPESWPFVGGNGRAEFANLRAERGPSYAEFWAAADIGLVPLTTLNDRQPRLDTPHDTLDRVNFANLAVQGRTALVLLKTALESPGQGTLPGRVRPVPCGRLTGRTLQFNIRSGIDAQEPVAGAYVYGPAQTEKPSPRVNAATAGGVRLGSVQLSRMDGAYALPLEAAAFKGAFRLFAARLDESAALFDRVLDNAQFGTQKQSPAFALQPGQDVEKNLILTPGYPLAIFPGVDPMDYSAEASVTLQDAVLNGAPQHYGQVSDLADFSESGLGCHLVFVEPGRRVRLILERAAKPVGLLVGELGPGHEPQGAGRRVGPGPGGDRNLVVALTPLALGHEMQALALRRQALYRAFGIRDRGIDEALDLSGRRLAEAEAFAGARRWQAAMGKAREAWGIVAKTYPGLMQLGREAVFSVIILMALLLPGCVFLESLAIGARTVAGRLAWAALLFTGAAFFLNAFHPAFRIAVSPFIVLIAFTMILASGLVLALSYQKFEVLVRRARIAGGEAESEEISLASSLETAFALGVSNLRKRKARTVLTVFTVSVLTFSTIAFVSVKGKDALFFRDLGYDRDIEGRAYQAGELVLPSYTGILFRRFIWGDLGTMVSDIRTEYGFDHEVVARGFYVEEEGGNNADREGVNQIEVAFEGKSAILTALMTFEPGETNFSRLDRAVSRGQWLEPAGASPAFADRFTVILPDTAAAALGITEDRLFDGGGLRPADKLPAVTFMNRSWRVVGILDSEKADRIRDINGESLAMVDHLRSAITPSQGSGRLENESDFVHLSWRRLGIIPLDAASDVGAKVKSAAVRFRPGEDAEGFLAAAAARLNSPLIGNIRGTPALITAKTSLTVAGAAKLIVPVILCILIVTNTMLGTVEERKGEVQMLGSIGLSPAQIAFLLMAESAVYSILGIVFGTFAGLLMACLAPSFPSVFGLLSFNFTSLASTGLALGTGLVVLAATLLPARRAAALAAPSGMEKWRLPPPGPDSTLSLVLPFTLTRGNAVGMLAFFRRFLLNHTETTGPDFNCRDVRTIRVREPADRIGLEARMWLAPYDLDAAQRMELRIEPTENAGVFAVSLVLARFSGAEEAWLRTNDRFLEQVRLQFLLWRNLEGGLRRRYIEEGAALLADAGKAGGG